MASIFRWTGGQLCGGNRTRKRMLTNEGERRMAGDSSDLFRFDLTATPWKRVPTHRGDYVRVQYIGWRTWHIIFSLAHKFEQPICWEVCKISEETLFVSSFSFWEILGTIFLRSTLFICITKSLYKVDSSFYKHFGQIDFYTVNIIINRFAKIFDRLS